MKKLVLLLLLLGALYWWCSADTVQGPLSGYSYEYIIRTSGGYGSSDALPMIIALHGNGDTPEHFFETLFKHFHNPARFILMKGPVDTMKGGFGNGAWPMDTEGLSHYGDSLADAVPLLTERFPTVGKPVLVGFSGGAFMAYYLAACHAELFSYIIPLSGGLPRPLSCEDAHNGARVIAFHGRHDQLISFGSGTNAVEHLRQRGMHVELVTFDGGHVDIFRSANPKLLKQLEDALGDITS